MDHFKETLTVLKKTTFWRFQRNSVEVEFEVEFWRTNFSLLNMNFRFQKISEVKLTFWKNVPQKIFSKISEVKLTFWNKRCQHCIQLREYWQVPLSNNTWVVSKQMGTIYAVPIHASRYILPNVDIVCTHMCACMCTCFWVHFIWC